MQKSWTDILDTYVAALEGDDSEDFFKFYNDWFTLFFDIWQTVPALQWANETL